MKKIYLVLFLLAFVVSANAQNVLENNPTGLKWRQVNTEHFKIIFPKGFETQAQRMANTLQHIHDVEARTLGGRARKISVVLQNQSSVSNGFVSVLPRRSEFYAMPSQNYNFLGNNDWLDLLASHEYRHVVQYQHAMRGFNRVVYYALGSTTFAALSQFAVPRWFWEGDAVATETAFTSAGRGRIPNFSLAFKTNLLEGRTFNYDKQYLRSYKHFIPDHYVLGYHMVSYLRKRENDPEVWEKITGRTWNVPFLPFWFSSSIHRHSGSYLAPLYRQMANDLRKEWQAEIDQLQLTTFEKINHKKRKGYTNYLYPQVMEDGSIVALKSGIGEIEQLVTIGERERVLCTPGRMIETGMISSAQGELVWNELGFDPRWRVKNFSLIKTYRKGLFAKRIVGGRKARYNGSALSPDAKRIASVKTTTDYKTSIVILDFEKGDVIKEFSNHGDAYLSMPRWSADGKRIVLLKTKDNLKSVVAIDAETGKEDELIPASEENIGYPVLLDGYLLFNSPISGIDNIYALDLNSKQRYQVTTSKYGAYNPAVTKDNKTIFYNDQSRDGMDVVKTSFDPATWKPFSIAPHEDPLVTNLVNQEGRPDLFDSIPQEEFKVKKYSRLKGLINPYSWGPYADYTLSFVDLGIKSKDILSTTSVSAGYVIDINERTGAWQGTLSYQGLYPIIDVQGTFGNRSISDDTPFLDTVSNRSFYRDVNFEWREQSVLGGLRIPLLLTNSRFHTEVEIGDAFGVSQISDFRNDVGPGGRFVPYGDGRVVPFYDYLDNGKLAFNHFSLSGYRLLKQSARDIYSKWGQAFYLDLFNSMDDISDFKGSNFSFYTQLYFPGLLKHHSLWGYWGYQRSGIESENNNYWFRNQIPLPRGTSMARYQKMYTMSGNYTLPVWYPDIALGPLLNIQRLRTNFFADYGFGTSLLNNARRTQASMSVGAEVKVDINILRFFPKLDIGFRYSVGQLQTRFGSELSVSNVAKFEFLLGTFNF